MYYVEVEPDKGLVAVVPQIGVEAADDGMKEQPAKVDEEKVATDNDSGGASESSGPVGVKSAGGEAHSLPQPVAPDAAHETSTCCQDISLTPLEVRRASADVRRTIRTGR